VVKFLTIFKMLKREVNMRTYEGNLRGENLSIGIVVSRFNNLISQRLLDGSLDCLKRHGVKEGNIDIIWAPGCFEIPMVVQKITGKNYDGIITLGAVIRGDTPHFDYIAQEAAKGIARLGIDSKIPISFGIITADTEEQALSRAGMKSGNKGWDAALSVLELANLWKEINGDKKEG